MNEIELIVEHRRGVYTKVIRIEDDYDAQGVYKAITERGEPGIGEDVKFTAEGVSYFYKFDSIVSAILTPSGVVELREVEGQRRAFLGSGIAVKTGLD